MAREIKDKVVRDKLEEYNLELKGLNYPQYLGEVKVDLEKIKLEKSESGLHPIGILDSLQRNYNYIKMPSDEQGEIVLPTGQSCKVEPEVVHMMKALVLEQASTSSEYSRVVAEYFTHLMRITLTKQPAAFVPSIETPVTNLISQKLKEFSKDRLPDIYIECDNVTVEERKVAEDE